MRSIAIFLLISALLYAGFEQSVRAAASETELREKLMLNKRKNTAEAANAIVTVIDESAARVGAMAKNPQARRTHEMFLRDAQDIVVSMNSPEAQHVFAGALGRVPLDGAVTLCYALRVLPANAEVDAAATRLLAPNIDYRLRTALTDLLAEHRYAAAFDKIAAGLDPNGLPAVQISTCRALQTIQDKRAIPALIKYMSAFPASKGGRYIYEATGALRTLSGQTFGPNPAEWKKWWDENQKSFAIDASKVIETDFNYELSEKQDLAYYEVPVVENRLVIVLDISGSMTLGGKPSRLDSAKSALKDFIKALPEKTQFNIIVFSALVKRWRKDAPLLPANAANKKDATAFVDEQKPLGGTQTALAMEEAIREVAVVNGCETIYLVTDGNPSPWGQNVSVEMQERLISWLNQGLKIRINTIGIYTLSPAEKELMAQAKVGEKEDLEKMKKFLYDLASNNDGVYREVGKDGGTNVVKFDPKTEKERKEKEEKIVADKAAAEKAKDLAGKEKIPAEGAKPDELTIKPRAPAINPAAPKPDAAKKVEPKKPDEE